MSNVGKGMWIWQINKCEGGNPFKIAQRAHDAGLSHVLIKTGDGSKSYGTLEKNQDVIDALSVVGIETWGWHYIYGDRPLAEAQCVIKQVSQYRFNTYILDVEGEYKAHHKKVAAKLFMNTICGALQNVYFGLSSYRYPKLHPQIPWAEFLGSCDIAIPQVYWEGSHNAGEQLLACYDQYLALSNEKLFIPTGAAYSTFGWASTPADVLDFMKRAKDLQLSGVNFWDWDHAGKRNIMWDTIARFDW